MGRPAGRHHPLSTRQSRRGSRRVPAADLYPRQGHLLVRRLRFSATGVALDDDVLEPAGRLLLVALGKAAPGLAAAFLARCQRPPDDVLVLAPDGVPAPDGVAPFMRVARHPLPDERGVAATAELRRKLAALGSTDGVVVLLSGGSSARLPNRCRGSGSNASSR